MKRTITTKENQIDTTTKNPPVEGKKAKKVDKKKFVRYKEGAEMYSMSQSNFEDMAHECNACYKVNKLVLVNTEIFEKYLETFRVQTSYDYEF